MNTLLARSSLLALALTSLAGTASAQTGAYDGFNYPAGTTIVGQTGGTGFSTPWQTAGYGSWQCDAQGMASLKVWQLMQGQSGSARSSSGGLQRSLSSPIAGSPGTSVWISFIARHTGPTSSSWLGVKLPCSGPGSDPFIFIGKPFGESNWGVDNGASGGVQSMLLPAVQKIRGVARIDFHAGRDDVTVWTNPALDAEPTLADAGLHLPAYGNFADLRKVLIETGSTGGIVSNSIDELRIGSTYAEVTPVEAGHVLDGFKIKPAAGSSSSIVTGAGMGMGPHVRFSSSSGALGCGGEIEMDSASGGSVTINPGDLSATSGEIKIKHKGWDGLIYGTHRSRMQSDGSLDVECDLTGTPVNAVRSVVRDGTGTVILDETVPGPLGHIISNGPVVDRGPCPDGGFPEWVSTIVFHDPPILVNNVWVYVEWVSEYRCPGSGSTNRVSVTNYGICDAGTSFSPGLGALEVSSPDLPTLDISGPATVFDSVECSGTGEVLVTEGCDDGTDCDDSEGRKLTVSNIGSSGQDGVEIKWRTASPPSGGSVTLGDILDTTGEAEMELKKNYVGHVTLIKQRVRGTGGGGAGGSAAVSCDFSGVGSTEYRVTAYREGSIVGETVLPNLGEIEIQAHIICGPGSQIVWGWVTELYWNPWPIQQSVRTYWGVVGCFKIGWGGNDPIPSDFVAFTPINPTVPFDDASSVTVAARDISEIVVTDIDAAARLCPADYNQDGFLDFFDYDDFVAAYETGTGNADFNGDGFVDFFDYDDFVLAYEVGC